MKKSFVTLILIFHSLILFAQIPQFHMNFGVKGGYTWSDYTIRPNNTLFSEQTWLQSPTLGIVLEFNIQEEVFATTGFYLLNRGFQFSQLKSVSTDTVNSTVSADWEIHNWGFHMPFMAGNKFDIGPFKIVGTVGGYVSHSVFTEAFIIDDVSTERRDITAGKDDDDYFKKWEYGLRVEMAFQIDRFSLNFFGLLGLNDVAGKRHNNFPQSLSSLRDPTTFKNVLLGTNLTIFIGTVDGGKMHLKHF